MGARSLNKVTLIGNLTRDPELRYTPAGTAVCTFGLATNRSWTTQTGETKEETEFHRIVAWNKLAELCSQLLTKGRKTYVEGRLTTHSWTAQDGTQRTTTEIVIEDMIILDSKRPLKEGEEIAAGAVTSPVKGVTPRDLPTEEAVPDENASKETVKEAKKSKKVDKKEQQAVSDSSDKSENITPDDIPF